MGVKYGEKYVASREKLIYDAMMDKNYNQKSIM